MKPLTLSENARARRLVNQPDAVTANARCHALQQYERAVSRCEQRVLLHRQRGDAEGCAIAMLALNAAVDGFDREFSAPEDDEQ